MTKNHLGLLLKSNEIATEALFILSYVDAQKGGELRVSVKAKDIMKEFSNIIEEAGLFLATVKDEHHTYPQLVVANLRPTKKGIESFCFFLFPYVITKIDDGNKTYNPKGIQLSKIYPCKGRILGISESLLDKMTPSFCEDIQMLITFRGVLAEIDKILKLK